MKKIKFIFMYCIGLLLLSGCMSSSGSLKNISYKEYQELIKNKESFVLEVMSTDCVHCQSLKPKLQKIVKEYGIEIKVINTQKLASEDYTEFTNIIGSRSTPIIIFYDEGEEKSVATRINGNVASDKIIEKFKDNGIIE